MIRLTFPTRRLSFCLHSVVLIGFTLHVALACSSDDAEEEPGADTTAGAGGGTDAGGSEMVGTGGSGAGGGAGAESTASTGGKTSSGGGAGAASGGTGGSSGGDTAASTSDETSSGGASTSSTDGGSGGGAGAGSDDLPPLCEGDGEPNETPSTACRAPLGSEVTSRLTSAASDAVDCYAFPVEAGVTYSLVMNRVSGPTAYGTSDNLFYEVTTDSGIVLLESSNIGSNAAMYHEMVVDTSEVATLCVSAGSPTTQYEYAFRIDEDWRHALEQDDATFEPNNTVSTAYPLTLGEEWTSRITALQADFVDCYRFDVEAGITYSLVMDRVSGPTAYGTSDNLFYEVTTDSGIMLLESSNIGSDAAVYHEMAVDTSEVATLCIEGGAHDAQYDYTLRIDEDWAHGLVQDDVTYEPNNTVATAYPVSLGTDWSSRFTTSEADYVDCYRFGVAAGTTYTLTVEEVSGPTAYGTSDNLFYELTTESGVLLVPEDNIGNNSANTEEFVADVTELATLCLRGGATGTQYDYAFRIDE